MHYKDGTPAQLGDVVRGMGYNIKHEVQGVVVGLTPGADSCNLAIAVTVAPTGLGNVLRLTHTSYGVTAQGPMAPTEAAADMITEYGQTDAFTLIARADGLPFVPPAPATAPPAA